jgi:hypothetical protein
MSAVTSKPTTPATITSQVSNILWQTGQYALEGAVITGVVVLAPHLVKSCLTAEKAKDFFLLVPDIHDAIAWTATATLIWPIGRHAQQAGTVLYKELSAAPRKIGNYFYSLFPTKTYDEKRDTKKLLYQNSLWGTAILSLMGLTYFGSSKLYHVVGLDSAIFPLITAGFVTAQGSYFLEKQVRKHGKDAVDKLESSNDFKSLCDITQRGWDFVCSGTAPLGITLLVGSAFPIQSFIASVLRKTTNIADTIISSSPAQDVITIAKGIIGIFSLAVLKLYEGTKYTKATVQTTYTSYVHPHISSSYKFAKTALFYSTIKNLCEPTEYPITEAQDALNNKTFQTLHSKYKSIWEDDTLSSQERLGAKHWLKLYPEDLADRCPQAENLTEVANSWQSSWKWSWNTMEWGAQETGKIFGRGFSIANDPVTKKVALLTLSAGITLYWVHALATKSYALLSPKKEKEPSVLEEPKEEDLSEKPSETEIVQNDDVVNREEHTETPPPVLEMPPVITEEISKIKPLTARTWTTKISDTLHTAVKKIQELWATFCVQSASFASKSVIYCEDLWQQFKRKLESMKKTPERAPSS